MITFYYRISGAVECRYILGSEENIHLAFKHVVVPRRGIRQLNGIFVKIDQMNTNQLCLTPNSDFSRSQLSTPIRPTFLEKQLMACFQNVASKKYIYIYIYIQI
jgi:hypothetical protein